MILSFTQYAVGKGGFHSFVIKDDEKQIASYVYDCGGPKKLVERELKDFKKNHGSRHDLFILSHFDRDHYSGLLQLKTIGITFKKYLIPLFNTERFLISLVQCFDASNVLEFLEENKDSLIIVTEESSDNLPIIEFNDNWESIMNSEGARRVRPGAQRLSTPSEPHGAGWNLFIMAMKGPALTSKIEKKVFGNKFVQNRVADLKKKVSSLNFIGLKNDIAWLKQEIRKLCKSYDFNLSCILLLSYPSHHAIEAIQGSRMIAKTPTQRLIEIFEGHREDYFSILNTGDFNFNCRPLLANLEEHLQNHRTRARIALLQIPHHGSAASYSRPWTKQLIQSGVGKIYAAVQGRTGNKFPAPSVMNHLHKLGYSMLVTRVTKSQAKQIELHIF